MGVMDPAGGFGALKVKADRGTCISTLPLDLFSCCCFMLSVPATTPRPFSTRAWPLEPALDPSRGISLRAWKFRGLRPRTTIGAVTDSDKVTLELFERVACTLR